MATATPTPKEAQGQALEQSLKQYNQDKNLAWTLGTNYSNIGTQFETYVNHYLFPKLQETKLINTELGNRFNFLAKETPYIAQLSEEYVILDSVPVDLNLTKDEELMLKRNYPKMATRLYGQGVHKKQKFTLNDNENRLNWQTLGDAIKYAVAVYRKKITDINVDEEKEIRAMLVDYGLTQLAGNANTDYKVKDVEELCNRLFESVLNIQNNSEKYNQCATASGGTIGRYTTQTPLEDMMILTTDSVKAYLLNTKIANTFQIAGLDLTNHIISFDDLGGIWKITDDATIAASDIDKFRAMGDYQVSAGDSILKGVVFTYDVSNFDSFKGKVQEIKPASKDWAMLLDTRGIYYKRNTQKLLPTYFYNNEMDEYTYWLHYYSFKAISPFYNMLIAEVAQ